MTAGPDPQMTAGPDFQVTAGPDFQVTAGPELQMTVGPDLRMTVGPDLRMTVGQDLQMTAGPELQMSVGRDFRMTASPENFREARNEPLIRDQKQNLQMTLLILLTSLKEEKRPQVLIQRSLFVRAVQTSLDAPISRAGQAGAAVSLVLGVQNSGVLRVGVQEEKAGRRNYRSIFVRYNNCFDVLK